MTEPASNPGPLAFGDFLSHLSRQGFAIGVDHHLRLQQLLDKTSADCGPQDLKTLLCPIFATDEKEQALFHRAFDSYFEIFQLPSSGDERQVPQLAPSSELPRTSSTTKRKRNFVAVYIVIALAFAALIAYFIWRSQHKGSEITGQPTPTPVQSPSPISSTPTASPTSRPSTSPSAGAVSPPPATPLPTPTVGPPVANFIVKHRNNFRLLVAMAPFVGLLLYEFIRFRRRRLILERSRGRRPPFTWPITVNASPLKDFNSEQFYRIARRLRQRQVAEFQRLDIHNTVEATIASGGYPTFRFKPDSRFPEYLALIDRVSHLDHQAEFFDKLVRALQREGLFVVRYFYNGDPRICSNESTQQGIFLTDLQKKYPEHRLLVFGNGERLIEPISGELVPWAALLQEWRACAILTPQNPRRWGRRERTLARNFILLPARLEALEGLAERLELSVAPASFLSQRNGFATPDLDRSASTATLRELLGDQVFEWLCACAIHPELQFELTLYLGSLLDVGNGLVREKNLLELIRLPWFRSGVIPDELRLRLIAALEPQKQEIIRSALVDLLEKSPPPPKTFAAASRNLDIVIQRSWLNRGNLKKLRQTLRALRQFPNADLEQDYTLIRFLESAPTSPLALLLPRRLKKLFYRKGIPAFGIKSGARVFATIMLMAVAWFGVERFLPHATTLVAVTPPTISVVNMIPKALSDEHHQNSQPVLDVYLDEQLMVSATYGYDSEGNAKPLLVSTDGGNNWSDNPIIPDKDMAGQDFCFSGSGRTLYAAILTSGGGANLKARILKTDNPVSADMMRDLLSPPQNVDGTAIQARAFDKDRIYVGINDFDAPQGHTATLLASVDGGQTFQTIPLEARQTAGQDGPGACASIAKDGVVYAALYRWTVFDARTGSGKTDVVVTRDDAGATGNAKFASLIEPGDGLPGRIVVTDRPFEFNAQLGEQRLGGGLFIKTDPNRSRIVYVGWEELDPQTRVNSIHLRKSSDGGQNWSDDLLTVPSATNGAIAIADDGTIGFLYQQFLNARWETHMRMSSTGLTSWTDTVLASVPGDNPKKEFDPYLGDKIALVSVGNNFYGAFSAANTPDLSCFPNGVRFQRNADFDNHRLLSTDGATVVETSIDPYFFSVKSQLPWDTVLPGTTPTPGDANVKASPASNASPNHTLSPGNINASASATVATSPNFSSPTADGNVALSSTPGAWPDLTTINVGGGNLCGVDGAAPPDSEKARENELKNRFRLPSGPFSPISFDEIQKLNQGNVVMTGGTARIDRFPRSDDPNNFRAVSVEGFVQSVFTAGCSAGESCNCATKDRSICDTQINVLPNPGSDSTGGRNTFVVEITQRVRILAAQGLLGSNVGNDWSTSTLESKLEGHRVRFSGYLFFDPDHTDQAWIVDPNDTIGQSNFRQTCWEIHPVMKIELLN